MFAANMRKEEEKDKKKTTWDQFYNKEHTRKNKINVNISKKHVLFILYFSSYNLKLKSKSLTKKHLQIMNVKWNAWRDENQKKKRLVNCEMQELETVYSIVIIVEHIVLNWRKSMIMLETNANTRLNIVRANRTLYLVIPYNWCHWIYAKSQHFVLS
jgi:hypothetical protein